MKPKQLANVLIRVLGLSMVAVCDCAALAWQAGGPHAQE